MRYFVELMKSNSEAAMTIYPLLIACAILMIIIVVLTIVKKKKGK
jgi:hypothetical protein